MGLEITVDASHLTRVVNGKVKKLRITTPEARKVMDPYAKEAYDKTVRAVQAKTKLGKADVKKRIRLTNKRAGGRRKGKGLMFYKRFYVWGRSSVVHLGKLLSPSAKPTGKGANRGLTVKGVKYPGAFISPVWGLDAGGKFRRVMRAKPGEPGSLESVNLDYNLLHDAVNKLAPGFIREASKKANKAAQKLIKKKMKGTVK